MRIIAGKMKGRKLLTPSNDAIRPTSDRMREALFNLLMHGQYGGEHIVGQRVMDICCGTGAVGLEAISRGAEHCTFIDQDRTALSLARDNAEHCGVTSQCDFTPADATRLPRARQSVALAFMDAPYASPLTLLTYTALTQGGWLQRGSLFVVEQKKGAPLDALPGASLIDQRQYGKAMLVIYRLSD